MAEAILTVTDQLVILKVTKELDIDHTLHHFREQGGNLTGLNCHPFCVTWASFHDDGITPVLYERRIGALTRETIREYSF